MPHSKRRHDAAPKSALCCVHRCLLASICGWPSPAQDGNQMAQLIFRIVGCNHCVRDFLVQQFPVTLTQSIEGLVHRVLSHFEFMSNLDLRRAVSFIHQQFLQLFKHASVANRAILLLQSREYLLQNCQCPATLENSVGAQGVRWLKISALACEQFIQWYKRPTFAALGSRRVPPLLCQEIFERGKEKGT